MTLPFSIDRLPAELGQAHQQVADAAGLVIGRRAMVGEAIDELLVLGADPPASRGFSPPANTDSRSSRLSMSGLALSSVRVVMAGGVSRAQQRAPAILTYGSIRRASRRRPP